MTHLAGWGGGPVSSLHVDQLAGLPAAVGPAAQLAHLGPALALHVDLVRAQRVAAVAAAVVQGVLNN